MKNLSSDKIAIIGLAIALNLSIIVGIYTGNGVELQMTIASFFVGYIGRVIQEKRKENKEAKDKKDKKDKKTDT